MVNTKRFALVIIMIVLLAHSARAQDSTRLQRIGYVVGASLAFSLADYIGFNLLKQADHVNPDYHAPLLFRLTEGMAQAAFSYFLYKYIGLNSAIAFNLMWWTWCDDFAYYGWGYVTGIFPWESAHESGLRFNHYTTAGWTPIGLLRPQGSSIAKSALLAQSAVGLTISMAILW